MSDEYTCAKCGGTFKKAWSDEEAAAEMVENFGDLPVEEQCVVCDDCYIEMTTAYPPKDFMFDEEHRAK